MLRWLEIPSCMQEILPEGKALGGLSQAYSLALCVLAIFGWLTGEGSPVKAHGTFMTSNLDIPRARPSESLPGFFRSIFSDRL